MSLRDRWRHLIDTLLPTHKSRVAIVVLLGVVAGIGSYLVYMSRVWSYAGDDPATCINCHVMEPYYATWMHSSHGIETTCNDCHVPHDSFVRKYFFKATDGLRHSYVFTMRGEPQSMKAIPESQKVIYENCIRCHSQLNQEFVKTGMLRGALSPTGRRWPAGTATVMYLTAESIASPIHPMLSSPSPRAQSPTGSRERKRVTSTNKATPLSHISAL